MLDNILHHLSHEAQLFDKNIVKHFFQVMQNLAGDYGKISSLGLYLYAPNSCNIRASYPSKETNVTNPHQSTRCIIIITTIILLLIIQCMMDFAY
jgi:hypothetical protein